MIDAMLGEVVETHPVAPAFDLLAGETQAAVGMFGAQGFVLVCEEVDDD